MMTDATIFTAVGKAISRVEGRLKVTGAAPYTAEHDVEGHVHGCFVTSAIASGNIISFDNDTAKNQPGVLAIFTSETAPAINPIPDKVQGIMYAGEGGLIEMLVPMQDNVIHYAGQAVALVVAETPEQARYAASLVKVNYEEKVPELDVDLAKWKSVPENYCGIQPLQLSTGDPKKAFKEAAVRLDQEYESPIHNHNPIELMSTIARWQDQNGEDVLYLYETTRVLKTLSEVISKCLDMPENNIHITCKYIGGAFGSKAWMFGNTLLVAACAKLIGKPVKVEWSRQQMFTLAGHRAGTKQRIKIGASVQGKISSMEHAVQTATSMVSGMPEPCSGMTSMMYKVPNLAISHDLRHLNLPSPLPMRGPGEMTGGWALESAMDELAQTLEMDPIELRLANYAEKSPFTKLPFSSKHLDKCYQRGKTLFGWGKRNSKPGSVRVGNDLIGYGFANNCHPAMQSPASARATIFVDGTGEIRSATHDLGNGAWTIFRQIASDSMSLPIESVRFELGDSTFPMAPITAGSQTTASVGPAVLAAGKNVLKALKDIARRDSASSLFGASPEDIKASEGKLFRDGYPESAEKYSEILQRAGLKQVVASGDAAPGKEREQFEFFSFGAVFAEIRVDVDTGVIRVSRLTGVYDVGRLINPKTAYSQLMGGMIFALGATLMEETIFDPNNGLPVVRNLADYHIPSCADAPEINIEVLGIPDPHISELGAHGVGEAACNGVPAAINNALYNATGIRIRSLPITPDKVLMALKEN